MVQRSFGPPSRTLVDYQLNTGGVPLDDVVEVNCKRGATTENKLAGALYMAKGCVFDYCVSII